MSAPLLPALESLLAAGEPVAMVTVSETYGSTPREAGAMLLVSPARLAGTIGGGQLEYHAIDIARAMLAAGENRRHLALTLGPHMGQCCGGKVALEIRRVTSEDVACIAARDKAMQAARPTVLVFGAGHTGRALARALSLLPLRTLVIDDRADELAQCDAPVERRLLDDPEAALADAPRGAAIVIMTHSHALDYRLAEAALRRGGAAYVGMIGSATKRARFLAGLKRGAPCDIAVFHCPIGGVGLPDKRPEVIAALTVADVVRAVLTVPSAAGLTLPSAGQAAESAA